MGSTTKTNYVVHMNLFHPVWLKFMILKLSKITFGKNEKR